MFKSIYFSIIIKILGLLNRLAFTKIIFPSVCKSDLFWHRYICLSMTPLLKPYHSKRSKMATLRHFWQDPFNKQLAKFNGFCEHLWVWSIINHWPLIANPLYYSHVRPAHLAYLPVNWNIKVPINKLYIYLNPHSCCTFPKAYS